MISLWVLPGSTCMDWSKVVKCCSNSVFVGRCWMASWWMPSHPIIPPVVYRYRSHPAWAKLWVCVSCSESFTLPSSFSFCKPWSTLFLHWFWQRICQKGKFLEVWSRLRGDRILFILQNMLRIWNYLKLVGKQQHQCFRGHRSPFFRQR